MPQSGTSVSVEAVDPVFQTQMLEMLKQTDRAENVVGWYHSHPGFGCWLSSVDVNTHGVIHCIFLLTFLVFRKIRFSKHCCRC
jgi:proteasome lid subunit RPN8/RPN11